ncbi:hypothetical protein HUW63_11775 [Myxococcus sp. AM001]|nr:hypothetical protein [Myxococcus sp. AM001]
MKFPIENPREISRRIVRESVDADLWQQNEDFTRKLERGIKDSRLFNHPVIASFARKEFTLKSMGLVHSEVRYAFAEHFGDGLIRLMETTGALERRLGAKAKMAARFLIQLNVLEELGYKPTPLGKAGFCGHPGFSHYWQLVDTLTAVGHPEERWSSYEASPESAAVRKRLLDSFSDHLRLAVVLAGIETAFIPYYGPWADNTLAVCPTDISDGYHSIHVEDESGAVVDTDHSEDSWFIVRQALTPDRYAEVESFLSDTVEEWARFVDMLAAKDREVKRAA